MSERAILTAYRRGETVASMVNRLGTSRYAIYKAINRHDVSKRKAAKQPDWPESGHGKWVDKQGYVTVWYRGKPRREHRCVMEVALGRRLLKSETVHHVNGDRSDNRIENLQLRQGHHGPGVVMCCAECGSHNLRPTEA